MECYFSIYSSSDVRERRSGGVYLPRTRMVWFGYSAWWRDGRLGWVGGCWKQVGDLRVLEAGLGKRMAEGIC